MKKFDILKCWKYCFIIFYVFLNSLQAGLVWTTPIPLSSTGQNASDPQIVLDANGNATAAWVVNNAIQASSLSFGGSWVSPVTLSDTVNISSNPMLGIDSSGNVTALWIENGLIESATLPFGGSWNVESSPISNSGVSSPAFSVDESGNVAAVWVRNGIIEAAIRTTGTWSAVATLSESNSNFPDVAISANGTVIVVWESITTDVEMIMSATTQIGENWNSPLIIYSAAATTFDHYPSVTIDNDGDAAVAWFQYDTIDNRYQNVTVLGSFLYANTMAWTDSTTLSGLGMRCPQDLFLRIVSDADGDVVAFWTNSYDGQSFNIESASTLPNGEWSNYLTLTAPSLYTLAADTAVNSASEVVSVYMDWNGKFIQIQSQESDIDSPFQNSWTAMNTISQNSSNGYPRCAYILLGNTSIAAAVWINFNGTSNVIQASIGSKMEISPPTSLSVVQNMVHFGIYTDFFNAITWEASASTNIIQYNIFRNGKFFGRTKPGTLQFVDHNTIENGSVTYGVAALDRNCDQSPIATITFP